MLKNAFSLVETLVATLIASLVVFALLQASSNNSKIINYADKSKNQKEIFSLVLLNAHENFHNAQKSIYEFVKDFNLTDEIKTKLKNEKISYLHEKVATLDIKPSEKELEILHENENFDEKNLIELEFDILKIQANSQNFSATAYEVKLSKN